MMRTLVIGLSIGLLTASVQAQEQPAEWTLRSCLDYALANNIQIKTSRVNELSGLEDTELAKAQLFPSLSASVTQGFVNYPSSDAESNNSYSGNYAVNANWTLFDGGQRNKTIKQQKLQNEVDKLSTEQSEDDIQIAIVQTNHSHDPVINVISTQNNHLVIHGVITHQFSGIDEVILKSSNDS